MTYKEQHLIDCKRKLYVAFLNKPVIDMTISDTEIQFALMQDPDIQEILDKKKRSLRCHVLT